MRKSKKILSTIMAITMLFSLWGCGSSKDNSDSARMPIDSRADIAENPTTEVLAESSTERATPMECSYTYNVDGVEITMNTNVDDFIHQDQYGYYVDLVGLAGSVGYSSNQSPNYQYGFSSDANPDVEVYFRNLINKEYELETICYSSSDHYNDVSFMRTDIVDDSIISYNISGDPNAQYRVNYEQIVIFAFLLENGAYAPNENWLEGLGFHNPDPDAKAYFKFYDIFK